MSLNNDAPTDKLDNLSLKTNDPIKELSLKCNDMTKKNYDHDIEIFETLTDDNSLDNNISDIKKCKNVYSCVCGKSFNHRQNLHTHKKTCKDLKYTETIVNLTTKLDTLTKEIENIKNQTVLANNSTITALNKDDHSNNITNSHNNTNIVNQKSINVVTYVNQNYTTANPLLPLKEKDVMQIITFDESCGHSLEEMIIFQHSKYLLHEFLGDFIINKYVQKDPKKQQIWLSNFKKLTFLVRHVLNKTDKVWLKDTNGVCITKHIITPILEEIKNLIDVYIKACDKKMHLPHTPINEFDKLHSSGFHGVKILYEIEQKILHHKILLHIAPYFQIQINNDQKMIELE
jgi:hypothetical protein